MTEVVNFDEPRRFRLDELFTEEELRKAAAIFAAPRDTPVSAAKKIEAEVVAPVIDRINRVTGQENNALYIAYALEAAFTQFLTKTAESKL